MVYCGKPSEACNSCRRRRIKCDKLFPCTQCSNKQLSCPGYRNRLDLCFRDESETVARKVKDKQSARHTAGPKVEPLAVQKLSPSPSEDDLSLSMYTLTPSLEDVAINHFLSTQLLGSHFSYLPDVLRTSSRSLDACVSATALATLSQETSQPAIMKAAQGHYTLALAQVHKALATPKQAILDTTLISVLLLSLFETVVYEGRGSPASWTAHTQGAAALLALRGFQQFETALGKELYIQVTNNLNVSCAQRKERIPDEVMQFQQRAAPFLDAENPSFRLSLIVESFGNLRANLRHEPCKNPISTIQTAIAIEEEVASLMESMPPEWQYETVPAPSDIYAYSTTYHKYPNQRIAQRWNSSRMMIIFLNNLIYHQSIEAFNNDLTPPSDIAFFGWLHLSEVAVHKVRTASEDICASVPQFAQGNSPPTVSTVAPLLWPLASAAESSLTPPELRTYVINRLYFLGSQARLPQASWAAQMLEESKDLEDWLHMYHVA